VERMSDGRLGATFGFTIEVDPAVPDGVMEIRDGRGRVSRAYLQEIRTTLERRVTYEQRQSTSEQVLEKITESAKWELPEDLVRKQVENALRRELENVVVDPVTRAIDFFADRAPLVWVAGYCNDMFGYVPTRRIQQEGGYEGGRANLWSWLPAPFTDEAEDLITHSIERLVQRVSQNEGT
jgi:hypothetical protein